MLYSSTLVLEAKTFEEHQTEFCKSKESLQLVNSFGPVPNSTRLWIHLTLLKHETKKLHISDMKLALLRFHTLPSTNGRHCSGPP